MTVAAISPDDDTSLSILKGWLADNGHTNESVKILRKDGVLWAEKRKSTQN